MKTKKLSAAMILLVAMVLVYIVATVLFCYKTRPAVTEGEFPFSITYEYEGETKTLSGVFKCEFFDSATILGEHNRYWEQETVYDNPENLEQPFVIEQNDLQQTTISLHENMSAGYFMGDPLDQDYYEVYGYESVEPYASYYDYENEIYLDGISAEEALESVGFRIVDFTYAEPIENRFFFSGIEYEADNIIIFVAIMFVFLILCLIFVRKDKEYRYAGLDKFGIVLNCLTGFIAVPMIFFFCLFFGLAESSVEIINQIVYSIPPFAILCLALSVVFRRKGYSKIGFFIQFGGLLPAVALFVLELIFKFQ